MNEEKFKMRIAVYLILEKNGETLLSRRFNTGWRDGWYSLVAGHVDGNETIAHAMIREAREESGISILEENVKVIHTMHRLCPDVEYIDFYLSTSTWDGEPNNQEPDKCDDMSWHPYESLPQNTLPCIQYAFENIKNGIPFSEWREPNA